MSGLYTLGVQTGFQGMGSATGGSLCGSPLSSVAFVCVALAASRTRSMERGHVLFPVRGVGPFCVTSLLVQAN